MTEPTCSKAVPELCGQPAVEFLLISSVPGEWSGKARCKDHPAADDQSLVQRVNPLLVCVIAEVRGR